MTDPQEPASVVPAQPEMIWQPIETAPKARLLLVYRPKLSPQDRIAIRRAGDWCGPTCCPSAEPTHWMSLPDPPFRVSPGAERQE